jgi:branched-chain amino acid transport system substrate-binding protein
VGALLAGVVISSAAVGADNTGITDTEVKLGGTFALSGPTAITGIVGKGQEAYYRYVNERFGGVQMADGKRRKINFVLADDAFENARAMANAQRLVSRDQVFAMVGSWGTLPNVAIRQYLNEEQVPHVFPGSQASTFSLESTNFPWTATGWMMSFSAEAAIYGEFLRKIKPTGTVAILYLNNDGGREMMRSFEKAIEGSGLKVVAKQGYELTSPTVDGEVAQLAQSKADVFFNVSTGKQAAQAIRRAAELGWKPLQMIIGQASYVETVLRPAGLNNATGLYTVTYMKDPADPTWSNDEEMKTYRSIIEKHGSGLDADDVSVLIGVAQADTIVKTLERSQPSRKSFVDQARNIKGVKVIGLRPGVLLNTSANDPFMIESANLQQFDGQRWKVLGDMVSYEGRSPR